MIEQTDNEIVYERKKMNRKIRRTVRLVIIVLGTCLSVFLLAVAVLINFIFTPEKLTPVVLNVANRWMHIWK